MQLYRFSPIKDEVTLRKAIEYIHFESYKLCKQTFGKYLPNSGNVGVFCHYDEEYKNLTSLRKQLTQDSENYNQKYFKLHEPIIIEARDGVLETTYELLYVRQPDPYRHQVGDIDFYLPNDEYTKLKARLEHGEILPGARMFPSPRLDMIELHNPDSDVLAYVSTLKMTEVVRSTKSES
jgi:hypothetical protein